LVQIDSYSSGETWSEGYGASTWDYQPFGHNTFAVVYDVTDPAEPKLLGQYGQSGYYVSSRLIGQTLYLVSSYQLWDLASIDRDEPTTFVPCTMPNGQLEVLPVGAVGLAPRVETAAYSVVSSLNVSNVGVNDSKAVLGAADLIYMAEDNLYLVGGDYSGEAAYSLGAIQAAGERSTYTGAATQIVRVALQGAALTLGESAVLPGSVLDQWALDQYDGHLRVVADVADWGSNIAMVDWLPVQHTVLYVLDSKLAVRGSIAELVTDESVRAVRFSGDVGYVVTFREVDPLFALDLADPKAPRVTSELKIPGFSTYLHPWPGDRLLGVGVDGDESGLTGGLKVAMFDVSDPFDIAESAKLSLPEASLGAAISDHRAVTVDVERGLIGFVAGNFTGWGGWEYLLFSYTAGQGFTLQARLPIGNEWDEGDARGYLIGEHLYVCSTTAVVAYSLADYARLHSVNLV
jgi:uncharacterized secreted protein with C-terminal beta-propeller domain